jgi:putative mRNA 3-end processing factor
MSVAYPNSFSVKLDRFATLCFKDGEVFLETGSEKSLNYLFISHAHFDHLNRSDARRAVAVCSEETLLLSTLRGLEVKRAEPNPFTLLDSGHILGSKALFVETDNGGILYTGDVNTSPVEGIPRQGFPRVHTLIIESNYGRPSLVFPPRRQLIREIVDYVGETIRKGRPMVLMGYPLGKSQHLQMILDPVLQGVVETYVSQSIAGYNNVYRLFSLGIRGKKVFSPQSSELPDGCWALYYPNVSGRNAFMQLIKRKYGAVFIGFSGRSLLSWYGETLGVDKAFPLSDHADFNGLMEIVRETNPEKVFTVHGFPEEFSRELRRLGYDSCSIRPSVETSLRI